MVLLMACSDSSFKQNNFCSQDCYFWANKFLIHIIQLKSLFDFWFLFLAQICLNCFLLCTSMRGHSHPTCGWPLMATYTLYTIQHFNKLRLWDTHYYIRRATQATQAKQGTRGNAGEFSKGFNYGGPGTLGKQVFPFCFYLHLFLFFCSSVNKIRGLI